MPAYKRGFAINQACGHKGGHNPATGEASTCVRLNLVEDEGILKNKGLANGMGLGLDSKESTGTGKPKGNREPGTQNRKENPKKESGTRTSKEESGMRNPKWNPESKERESGI